MFLLALVAASQVAPADPTATPAAAPTAVVAAPAWMSSYDDAYRLASQQRKPVLVMFTNRAANAEQLADLRNLPGIERFVPVFASKQNDAGRKIFETFKLTGDEAFVVLDSSLRWQFLRYERQLNRTELQTVLTAATQNAGQISIADPLRNVSAYVNPGSPAATGTPTMPNQSFYTPGFGGYPAWGGSSCPNCRR